MIEPYTQKIFFVDEPFLDELKHTSLTTYQAFTVPEIDSKIITLPAAPSDVTKLVEWMHPSEIRVGGILAKAGYTDQFVSVDVFSDDHAVRKYGLWILLCTALGAKKVSVTNIENVSLESEDMTTFSINAAGKATTVQAEASFQRDEASGNDEARKAIMNIKVDALGGEPDLAEAKRILDQYGLHNDHMFRGIYDMRSVSSNRLTKHEFSLDLSSDVKRIFDSSMRAKIEAMSILYDGRAEFDTAKKTFEKARTALKLSIAVEF